MNGLCDQFFSGAAFTGDEYGESVGATREIKS